MPLTELQIAKLVERYIRERDRYEKMASVVSRHLSAQLRASAISHLPTFRSKDPESLSNKLTADRERYEFAQFDSEFAPSVLDVAGVRILLYRRVDVEPTCRVIEELFVVPGEQRFHRDYSDPNGYQGRHRVVTLLDEMLDSDTTFANLAGVYCEVQVVTFDDHIWNELEHDIRYKTPNGKPNEVQAELLGVLRDQLNPVRSTVDRLMEATARQRAASLSAINSPEDLSEVLKARTGRRLQGDFGRLLELLSGTFKRVTPQLIETLPLDQTDLNEAVRRLSAAEIDSPDDVAMLVAALWPGYRDDLLEISGTWRGRPGSVARVLHKLEGAQKSGKI